MEDRSRSSRLVRELREIEGEEVSPSFWGVWVPPGAGVVPGEGEEGTEGMGLGPTVVTERGRI